MGDKVTVYANANCSKELSAKIIIGHNCDICCNLIAKADSVLEIGHHTRNNYWSS